MQTWMDTVDGLSNAALTVEAQTVPLPDGETFLGESLFPRLDVNSVKVEGITVRAIRPVSERREWNAPGATIEKPIEEAFGMSILPIEARDGIDEQEYQALAEAGLTAGQAQLRALLGVEIPKRIRDMAVSNLRRLEMDRYSAWLEGLIRQRNPQNKTQEIVATFPWAGERIQTAGTAWDQGGVNAYNEFIAWLKEGVEEIGAIEGVMLRQRQVDLIQNSAPFVFGTEGERIDGEVLRQKISQKIGVDFRFIVNRAWVEPQGTKRYLMPIARIGIVPAGGAVGKTLYAPVVRAIEAADVASEAGIDLRGQASYRETSNGGKHTELQVQVNAAPNPDKLSVWVMNTGVAV